MSDASTSETDVLETASLGRELIQGELKVSQSDDGQYLLIYAGQVLLAIYGAMGADPEVVEFASGGRYAVQTLLDMTEE